MTSLLFSEDGVYGPDLEARTKHPGSVARYQSRGGALPRRPPAPAVRELKPHDTVEQNGWKITVGAVIHVQPYLTCYGYRLDCAAGSIAYSGDTGPCQSMIQLARGCDVLIHMCHYISGSVTPFFKERTDTTKAITGHLDLAQIAQEAGVKNLVITHVSEPMDVDGVRERLIADIAEVYKGNIFFGQDLMEIPLAGPPARIKARDAA
jgi:ribonuclease BN (tRNA processing enzyme)